MMIGTSESQGLFMEELYKGTLSKSPSKRITALYGNQFAKYWMEKSREFIKQLDWPLGYDTSGQAKKAGLLLSKKWIDAGKRNL
jgi:hypothetical protein